MKSKKVKAYAKKRKQHHFLKKGVEEHDSNEEHITEESSSDNEDFEMEQSLEEEEVLPITDDEESEDEDNEEDLPKLDNWGKRKGMYYNADFVDQDRGKSYRDEDLEKAIAEREAACPQMEALIASQLADTMMFQDSGMYKDDSQKSKDKEDEDDSEKDNEEIQWEKLEHEKRKHPKLVEYKEEFKQKFSEINDRLAPLIELSSCLNLDDNFINFVKLKYQNLLHYLLNISFYLYLKNAENIPINHPIYERIEQFKKLDEKFNAYTNFLKEVDFITKLLQENEELASIAKKLSMKKLESSKNVSKIPKTKPSKEKKSVTIQLPNDQEDKMLIGTEQETDINQDFEDKRTISYQIAKNKGLRPRRKKEVRNPRVHNRMKFRKANIRRKGQVKQVVKEMKRYAGEPTGISTHVVRSIKLK